MMPSCQSVETVCIPEKDCLGHATEFPEWWLDLAKRALKWRRALETAPIANPPCLELSARSVAYPPRTVRPKTKPLPGIKGEVSWLKPTQWLDQGWPKANAPTRLNVIPFRRVRPKKPFRTLYPTRRLCLTMEGKRAIAWMFDRSRKRHAPHTPIGFHQDLIDLYRRTWGEEWTPENPGAYIAPSLDPAENLIKQCFAENLPIKVAAKMTRHQPVQFWFDLGWRRTCQEYESAAIFALVTAIREYPGEMPPDFRPALVHKLKWRIGDLIRSEGRHQYRRARCFSCAGSGWDDTGRYKCIDCRGKGYTFERTHDSLVGYAPVSSPYANFLEYTEPAYTPPWSGARSITPEASIINSGEALWKSVDRLPEFQRKLIYALCSDGGNQTSAGAEVGVSQPTVSRQLKALRPVIQDWADSPREGNPPLPKNRNWVAEVCEKHTPYSWNGIHGGANTRAPIRAWQEIIEAA